MMMSAKVKVQSAAMVHTAKTLLGSMSAKVRRRGRGKCEEKGRGKGEEKGEGLRKEGGGASNCYW